MQTSSHLTHDDLVSNLGEIDDLLAVELIATGASASDLQRVMSALDGDVEAPLDREGRLIAIRDLLEFMAEDEPEIELDYGDTLH